MEIDGVVPQSEPRRINTTSSSEAEDPYIADLLKVILLFKMFGIKFNCKNNQTVIELSADFEKLDFGLFNSKVERNHCAG